jgi:uncharacterized RDD family membrane protein YckC
MNWYYAENGQKAGPIDEAQLEELRAAGRIQPATLVWREGMANWTPFSQVQGELKPAFTLKTDSGASASGPQGSVPEAVCTECNRIYPTSTMMRYGEAHVCANCKPRFMQKLAAGAGTTAGAGRAAGFWIRFAAVLVDGVILSIVNLIIKMAVVAAAAPMISKEAPSATVGLLVLVTSLVSFAIAVSYETLMIGQYGATVGKMICKIHVVTAEGGRVSYLRALGRYFAKVLSALVCFIGFIIAGFDEQKRALHDHICSTRVVNK